MSDAAEAIIVVVTALLGGVGGAYAHHVLMRCPRCGYSERDY